MNSVLVVDDSRTTRHYHVSRLAAAGYLVATAIDGAGAREKPFAPELRLNRVAILLSEE